LGFAVYTAQPLQIYNTDRNVDGVITSYIIGKPNRFILVIYYYFGLGAAADASKYVIVAVNIIYYYNILKYIII